MQEQEAIKSLYAVITGQQYEVKKPPLTIANQRLWESATVLFQILSPTDEQIARLLFYKFTEAPPEKLPVKRQEERKSEGRLEKISDDELVVLEPGMVRWTVEIDGVPTAWMLNYHQSHLPVKKGERLSFQGKQYRISKIYGTSLYLTSQDSDVYQMSHAEAIG